MTTPAESDKIYTMKPYILLDVICPDRGALIQWELAAFLMFPENPHQAQADMPSNLLEIAPVPLCDINGAEMWNFGNDMLGKAKQLGIELFMTPQFKGAHEHLTGG